METLISFDKIQLMIERAARTDPGYAVWSPVTAGVAYIPGENFDRQYKGEHRKPDSRPILIRPSLGKVWVAVDNIAHHLGLLTITDLKEGVPFSTTNQTINLGVSLSPADVCFPYKPMLGIHAEAALEIDKSKDRLETIFGPTYNLHLGHGSAGTCRERVYSTAMEFALHYFYQQRFGHNDFDFYSVRETGNGFYSLISYLMEVSDRSIGSGSLRRAMGAWETLKIVNGAIDGLDLVERFEDDVRLTESLISDGSKKSLYDAEEILRKAKLTAASTGMQLFEKKEAFGQFAAELQKLEQDNKQRSEPKARIAIGGEMYCVEETGIEEELVLHGFYPDNTMGLSRYTSRFHFSPREILLKTAMAIKTQMLGIEPKNEMAELAREMGMSRCVGGHGRETLELIAKILKEIFSYDGVMILKPFNCLPQIVTQSIIAQIDRKGLPILHLDFDEQTGKAGLATRIEAFTDLVLRQKAARLRALQVK